MNAHLATIAAVVLAILLTDLAARADDVPKDPIHCLNLQYVYDELAKAKVPPQRAQDLMRDPEYREYVGPVLRYLKFGGTREMLDRECAI